MCIFSVIKNSLVSKCPGEQLFNCGDRVANNASKVIVIRMIWKRYWLLQFWTCVWSTIEVNNDFKTINRYPEHKKYTINNYL